MDSMDSRRKTKRGKPPRISSSNKIFKKKKQKIFPSTRLLIEEGRLNPPKSQTMDRIIDSKVLNPNI